MTFPLPVLISRQSALATLLDVGAISPDAAHFSAAAGSAAGSSAAGEGSWLKSDPYSLLKQLRGGGGGGGSAVGGGSRSGESFPKSAHGWRLRCTMPRSSLRWTSKSPTTTTSPLVPLINLN